MITRLQKTVVIDNRKSITEKIGGWLKRKKR